MGLVDGPRPGGLPGGGVAEDGEQALGQARDLDHGGRNVRVTDVVDHDSVDEGFTLVRVGVYADAVRDILQLHAPP
jgi:hypothetical protein